MSFNRKPPAVFKVKHKQRNGEYHFDSFFSFKVMHRGKLYYEKTTFTKKREAQAYVNEIFSSQETFNTFLERHTNKDKINDFNKDSFNEPEAETVLSVLKKQGWLNWETNPKYINHKMQGKNYGSRHTKNLTFALRYLFVETKEYEWFGKKNISSITRSDAQQLSSQLWKNRTCYGEKCEGVPEFQEKIGNYKINIVALKTFFSFCFDELGIIEINPFYKIKIPKSKNLDQKPFFTKQQLRTMFDIDLLKSISSDPKWHKFLDSDKFKSYHFVALTGLRSGEVRALKWKQLHHDRILIINRAFKENTIQEKDIDTPKWNKTRSIVLSDSAYEALPHRKKDPKSYIFQNYVGKAIDASTWDKDFRFFITKLVELLSFPEKEFRPHCFRGTLNTLLIKGGTVPESLVRKYLGWSESNPLSPVQETHYTYFTVKDMLIVAQGIELIYSGNEMLWEFFHHENEGDIEIAESILYHNSEDLKALLQANKLQDNIKEILLHKIVVDTLKLILADKNLPYEKKKDWISFLKPFLKIEKITPDQLQSLKNSEAVVYTNDHATADSSWYIFTGLEKLEDILDM